MYTVVNKLDVECQQALIHCRELEDKKIIEFLAGIQDTPLEMFVFFSKDFDIFPIGFQSLFLSVLPAMSVCSRKCRHVYSPAKSSV
jgi:hypothetical protein